MPSTLDRTIARTRRRIDDLEGPVRRQMADLYARTVRNLNTDLELVTQRIQQARDAGTPVNPDWLRRQDRYIRLVGQAEREFARFADDGLRLIESGRIAAVRGGAAEAWELLDVSGIERAFGATINTLAVENAMAATYSGPVKRSLARYGPRGSKTITDTLLDGIARGRGPRAIIRDIQRGLNAPYNQANLESLVRTEMMRGFRAGLAEQYAPMAHLIAGYRRTAAKSLRTCLACLALDGRIYPKPEPNFHIRCRCIYTPVPKNVSLSYESGEDWFARQPAERQQRMMPTMQAWEAYRDKRVTLNDFVNQISDRTWGDSAVQKSGRQALEDAA